MPTQVRVLVVDDSALMRKALKSMLVEAGFAVETARNGLDALEQVKADPPDVVTLDVNMPEMDGMTCLARLMADTPLPVVMVSSLTDSGAQLTFEALELGAVDYVFKPGGTVSLDIDTVQRELVAKVTAASRARVRSTGGLRDRMRRQREEAERGAGAAPRGAARLPSPRSDTPRARRAGLAGAGGVSTTESPGAELVLVGSSTGGPAALTAVVGALPRFFTAPVVIAQHIPATFTKHLAARLHEHGDVDVREVVGTEVLVPGVVYLGRGGADVVIVRAPGGLAARSVPSSEQYRWHPSVDRLVASALATCDDPRRLIGVLLTGMGDDGAAEMTRLHEAGGRTIAESEETAVVYGMPAELARRGGADLVLPLEEIGGHLGGWA